MDWRYGSSDRAPSLQAQNPKFRPQSYQKQKKKQNYVLCNLLSNGSKNKCVGEDGKKRETENDGTMGKNVSRCSG
jgi:hypothetical protein